MPDGPVLLFALPIQSLEQVSQPADATSAAPHWNRPNHNTALGSLFPNTGATATGRSLARACFLVLAAAATAVSGRSQTVACPESITVTESTQASGGWRPVSAKAEHRFERISVFNGKQGGEEYDLAPDDEKTSGRATIQTWVLKDYRSMNLFVRCRYHATEVTLEQDLPAPLQTCTLTFEIRKDGTIVGKSTAVCR
ncbi:MAG TPA: STY0301 family protein [Bryobacteraceae bacterium]|nr:STY0301 family protein [Bryobacteraceae bacterium]